MVNGTPTKILNGALHALTVEGQDRLSMSSVAQHARVSRGTLYRYFPTRELLLDALGKHVTSEFERAVHAAAAGEREPRQLVRRVFTPVMDEEMRTALRRLRELQPEFMLEFLSTHFREHVKILQSALQPALDATAKDRDPALTPRVLTELLTRLSFTTTLIDRGESNDLPKQIVALWDSIHARGARAQTSSRGSSGNGRRKPARPRVAKRAAR